MRSLLAITVYVLVTILVIFSQAQAEAPQKKEILKGLRVDPSYFYQLYPRASVKEIARTVVNNAKTAHVNTLFLYAYNPGNGAFYPTHYPMTEVEVDLGRNNIFGAIVSEANVQGLRVIAVIPVNDFETVWIQNPSWRSKMPTGSDYKPFPRAFFLSAWHPEFRKWLRGFVQDLVNKFPGLYAVEAVEPMVDCYWKMEADFNEYANREFQRQYPQGILGDANWRKVRAQGMTELLGIMAETVHTKKIKTGIVQVWPAFGDGVLFSSREMRDEVGFDLEQILNLKGPQKIDFIVGELMWQQWLAEYGTPVFTPQWSRAAAQGFLNLINNRTDTIIHVEISPWHGQHSTVVPTLAEFHDSIFAIKDIAPGIDVYDHSQIESRQAWSTLGSAFKPF